MTADRSPDGPTRPRTGLRIAACAALGAVGAVTTAGCLLALFLANLTFFGERPQVPLWYKLALLAGAAAGIAVPAAVTLLALDTAGQRLIVAALMVVILALVALSMVALLGS